MNISKERLISTLLKNKVY